MREVTEEEMAESGQPALHCPDSPGSPGAQELQEVLGFSLLCWSGLPPGLGAASGQVC